MAQPSYWDLYPNEMLWELLLELPFHDLLNVCQTEKRVKDICDENTFWKVKYRHDFSVTVSPPLIEINWRQQYIFDSLMALEIESLFYMCSKQPIFDHVCNNDLFWKKGDIKKILVLPCHLHKLK